MPDLAFDLNVLTGCTWLKRMSQNRKGLIFSYTAESIILNSPHVHWEQKTMLAYVSMYQEMENA